ncbi:ABC transporter substrate-binding protein [Hydrogenophaga crassostreae]|uniref:ABC transporter substrate-binding protein n=1 Tax=Hydrogenophaga crassostreae TaxID=1763535 RepID=A0A167GQZ3_9BURK|nr:tripartite tricarboxylate transporter substrate binding protein [Hydrogenophaga crassostreae]AOW11688.1 ABC transporter substrate-binding protein [Hydrogenophaga crassostreae]OAD39780.1 ABC transporter substrate-binding protein [Hydrogenophaga crassostreae]
MKRRNLIISSLTLVGTLAALPALAAYPEKPVTVICPWSAGGGTDTLLRALSKEAEKHLGQTINVVNQTGGAGAIGHNAIRAARPDGYTVGMITFELNSLPPQGLVPFTWKDFDPLMRINSDPAALTVKADAPYSSVRGFMDYAKANPGEITIGNSGPGSVWHIAAGLAADKTGVTVKHVPFDGANPAVTALVGGHIKAVAVSVAEVKGQVQAGNLKILGVMSSERDKIFPDVQTFKEQGVDVQFYTWRGLALPKGVPAEAKTRIADAYKKAFDSAEFKDFAAKASLNLSYQDSAAFTQFLGQNASDVESVMKGLGLAKK